LKHKVLGSVSAVETTTPVIALTYDDGPDPEHTPAVLAALARHNARATFFVLAEQAEAAPELVRQTRAEGHEIGLHGAEHLDLARSSLREIITVIRNGRQRLEAVLGEPVRHFRPPYGRQTVRSRFLVRAFGMDAILWSTNARDCFPADVDEYVAQALDGLRPGGIVLLHDGYAGPDRRDTSVAAQPPSFDRGELTNRLLDAIATRGWTTIPVKTLLTHGPTRRVLWLGE
jgi:peptidoglycan/xylan/chitin deacetylase (PgdA/CDA1 family)